MNFKRDDGFQNRSFIGTLLTPFRAIQEAVSDGLSGEKSFSDGQGNMFIKVLTLPFRLLWGFLVFMVQAWTTSRNGLAFLRGLPAFGILILTPFMLWGLQNYSSQISLSPTIGYHSMFLRNQEFDRALLYSKKMVELKPESKDFKYRMAEDIARTGDVDAAARVMNYLAGSTDIEAKPTASSGASGSSETADIEEGAASEPEEEPEQYAQAHVWLSQQLIRKQQTDGFDEERNSKAMAHLRAAVAVDPENVRAKVNLANLYLTRARSLEEGSEPYIENLKLARGSLESLTAFRSFNRMEQVQAMPQLVDICVKLGDTQGAQRNLLAAEDKVTRIARLNPEIYEIWFSLVQCAVALKDYEQANKFIRSGHQNVKSQETRRRIMQLASLVHIQEADDFMDTTEENSFRERLFALCKAIATNPRDAQTYERLVEYIDVDLDPERRDVWLRNAILDCPIPGVVHILIGTRELLRGDVSAGKTSWDIAQHQFGTTEFVTHRLLSVAIRRKPEYGETNLLNAALLLFPDQYMLYETRGTIKKRRADELSTAGEKPKATEEYLSAIADFKIVLEKVPDLITVREQIKKCYEMVGDSANMQIHADRVAELMDQADEKQRALYERVLDSL